MSGQQLVEGIHRSKKEGVARQLETRPAMGDRPETFRLIHRRQLEGMTSVEEPECPRGEPRRSAGLDKRCAISPGGQIAPQALA
jgi:hypothetical protein